MILLRVLTFCFVIVWGVEGRLDLLGTFSSADPLPNSLGNYIAQATKWGPDRMVVLGQFEYVDGVRVNGVAIRNQSGQWSGLQDSDSNVIGVGDGNRILATSALGVKDDLIVGGWFTKAGGKSIKGVTKWDADAQTFNSVPSDGQNTLQDYDSLLECWNGEETPFPIRLIKLPEDNWGNRLLAVGRFEAPNSKIESRGMALLNLDTDTWEPIGGGVRSECNETAAHRFAEVYWVNSAAVLNNQALELVFIGEHTAAMNADGVSVDTGGLTKWTMTPGSNPPTGTFSAADESQGGIIMTLDNTTSTSSDSLDWEFHNLVAGVDNHLVMGGPIDLYSRSYTPGEPVWRVLKMGDYGWSRLYPETLNDRNSIVIFMRSLQAGHSIETSLGLTMKFKTVLEDDMRIYLLNSVDLLGCCEILFGGFTDVTLTKSVLLHGSY